jgi:hypothetical protein
MKYLITVFLVFLCPYCFSDGPAVELNPSAVWKWHGVGPLTSTENFSWGENPTYNQATVIDLSAKKPFIDTWDGEFFVLSTVRNGRRYIFNGIWAEGQSGAITIEFIDSDTIWFVSITPGERDLLGEKNFFKRVPMNATVTPIDPKEGP